MRYFLVLCIFFSLLFYMYIFEVDFIFTKLLIDMLIIVLDVLLIKRMYFLWANDSVSLH